MKVENKKKVAVNYKLTVEGVVADESRPGEPLEFIFGMGMLLPKFEAAIEGKEAGDKVAFTLEPADGYGESNPEAIVELPKTIFEVEGSVPDDMLFEGNHIPMADAQGNRLMGIVKSVGEESVTMDFNHPMAGATLNFEVEIVTVKDSTPEDFAPQGGGCGCGCGDSECSCDGDCSNGCN